MPKVSVLIPVYNVEEYLRRCLDSVINQSFKDLEIICVDNKSEDLSGEILDEYAKKDERIKVIHNEKNMGSAYSRNVCLDTATGKYISFVDSDDYIDEQYIEKMYNKIEEKNCDIALNFSIYREHDGISERDEVYNMPEITEEGVFIDNVLTINHAPCMLWARIYKREFLEKNKLRFLNVRLDDAAFNIIATISTEKTLGFWGEKYHYTVRDKSITGKSNADGVWDLDHIKAFDAVYDYLKEHNRLKKNLKLFQAYSVYFNVDSEEKFNVYKMFFEKIKDDFYNNEEIYSDFEKEFAKSILNAKDFQDYKNNFHGRIRILKLINKKNNCW